MKALTLILTQDKDRRVFPLAEGQPAVVVGRSPDVPVSFNDRLLSRRHCELLVVAKQPIVRDLKSANGTYLNGRRIDQSPLKDGDVLRVGDVELRVQVEASDWLDKAAAQGDVRCERCGRLMTVSTVDDTNIEWTTSPLCSSCKVKKDVKHADDTEAKVIATLEADGLQVLDRVSSASSFAPVYRARREGLSDIVAIKALPLVAGLSVKKIARFRTEARAMAQIKHPNVAHVYDVRQKPDLIYVVMEYIEGEPLLGRIERKKKLPASEVLEIGVAIARALEAAAKQKIVHRNIKPANILIAREDGTPKLVEFGLALANATPDKKPAAKDPDEKTVGTLRYMAPEQMEKATSADARSDIYALAATLFHALTGRLPYPEKSEVQLLKAYTIGALPAFDPTKAGEIPEVVGKVLAKALRLKPSERHATATEFREDLAQAQTALASEKTTRRLAPKGDSAPGMLNGHFEHDQLVDLVQMLGHTRKTGVLEIATDEGGGLLGFRTGKVVAAWTQAGARGVDAAHHLLSSDEGTFAFKPGLPPTMKADHELDVQALLMEVLRRRDEKNFHDDETTQREG